jgi:hypothetical protein
MDGRGVDAAHATDRALRELARGDGHRADGRADRARLPEVAYTPVIRTVSDDDLIL